ncbi:glycosyltransferase family 4 protein [Sphingobacterium bovisgrunnientis]|uniref:glycosyltransferase family 4 protein n=1 Tax=Sphingobacterium bovisgrunnientis TaxID=1874697 RepID=UPI00135826B5|nr:glycosyltransferase family 4 protein [Sphingobacterium bovisgrunnientis]
MKILYYLPSLYASGGLERIIVFKANYFASNFPDTEVIILTSEQRGLPSYFPLSQNVRHIDLDVVIDYPFHQSPLMKALRFPGRYFSFKKKFIHVLQQERPDIVISTIRREINFLPLLKDSSVKLAEFHVTKKFYNPSLGNPVSAMLDWVNRIKERQMINKLRQMDALVFLTEQEKGFWPELNNLHVIPNPSVINPTQQADCQAKRVIAVGRFAPQKGFDLLIAAWSFVVKKHPDWELKIYGEGMRENLQKQIDRLAIGENCKLEDTTVDIEEKYCESSIFVLSSRYEGFGMVLVEAMSCGVPAVAFDCPCGPSEIIRHGEDGLLVENGNIRELAENICVLIEDDGLRKRMGAKARLNSERYQMEHIAPQWRSLFESLL